MLWVTGNDDGPTAHRLFKGLPGSDQDPELKDFDYVAVFDVPDTRNFDAVIELISGAEEYIVGVTRCDIAEVLSRKFGSPCQEKARELLPWLLENHFGHCCFIHVSDTFWSDEDEHGLACLYSCGKCLTLSFHDRVLTLSCDDAGGAGPHTLPAGDYYPCVFLKWRDTVLSVTAETVGQKRMHAMASVAGRLFKDRRFTDAVVVCSGHRIPVHQAVLAGASPVFDRMFGSGMREAVEASIQIDDVDPVAVEMMIEHIYIARLSDGAPLAQLFGLAKRYALVGLAEDVGVIMLEHLDSTNVSEYSRVVRLHARAGDLGSAALWDRMCSKLNSDVQLNRSLLEELLDT